MKTRASYNLEQIWVKLLIYKSKKLITTANLMLRCVWQTQITLSVRATSDAEGAIISKEK
jgi:hypothetical protein